MTAEKNFRPQTFADFSGQEKAKKMLEIYIKAAKIKGECLDHILLSAASGCGKSTFAQIIANEAKQPIRTYSGPNIKTPTDMRDILSVVQPGEIIFIDEIHALSKKVQEVLYFGMEEFVVDQEAEDGLLIRVSIPHFTLIGATTDLGGLEAPCRNRFQIHINLVPYSRQDMGVIVRNIYRSMHVFINQENAEKIGKACRFTPRIANSYCRRIYDFALIMNDGEINAEIIDAAFDFMDINKEGLTQLDVAYLKCLNKGRMGLETLCMTLGTDKKTIKNAIEPFLVQREFIIKTPRGRQITEKGMRAIGIEIKE